MGALAWSRETLRMTDESDRSRVRDEARALASKLLPLAEEAERLEIYGNRYRSEDWHRIHPQLRKLEEELETFLADNDIEILAELARGSACDTEGKVNL